MAAKSTPNKNLPPWLKNQPPAKGGRSLPSGKNQPPAKGKPCPKCGKSPCVCKK